ncbi:Noc2p family-domain-containing protein [Gymnopilus junonius]|uniref:Noc2p family-domain-containing protein n=1 Tax=Gymnopilus junonius TaxID=109634 RepID=A0A9P5N8P3_GYMJU|nr:Noc2p family-domain-containing protein [Gymnopilus junonius]
MTVDSFLSGDFMDDSDEDDQEDDDMGGGSDESENEDDEEGAGDSDDDGSFASVDELDEEGKNHLLELSKLAEKDPEFFKYLQENDKELLNFDPDAIPAADEDDEEDADGDVAMDEEEKVPVLTKEQLKKWQKSILEQRSLRALRKLLIAFRSAAHMNEEDQVLAWSIDSSSVFNKLVVTTLRYTPIVLEHHAPYKTLSNGKFKAPAQNQKFKTLQKLILSHFHNTTHILSQLTDEDQLRLALTESAKLVPYIISSRKSVKAYLKKCLELWSSGSDSIRIAAFLSVRKLAAILKSTYLTLVRSSKSTSAHTLPSINLMKNSASEVFYMDHATAYQHAFGYIRQLAIHLRNSMKSRPRSEAYKQVYNWQFAHLACDAESERNSGKQSELRPLIYPLVQVALGAISTLLFPISPTLTLIYFFLLCRLVPNSRSTLPFANHPLSATPYKHTQPTFLSAYLVPILSVYIAPSSRPKSSTSIRIPQQYTTYLLADGSIGFPEIIVPIVVLLRKSLKGHAMDRLLLLGAERGRIQRRKNVQFAPSKLGEVQDWERTIRGKLESESPLGKYLKARKGEDEILRED